MADDEVWKRRFLAYSALRLGGLIIFFLGIAIAYGNLLRDGGWPQLGAIIAILGALDTVLAPRLLKKAWDERDRDVSPP
jgi:membrane protein implicated in regulation of membrane protease activity